MADQGVFNSFLTPPGSNPNSLSHIWESHRPIIKKLYVDEGKPLKRVMEIMEREYSFRASKKVYRNKLNKWGFEKRIKVSEAEFILRRWIERGACGKDSEFTLRGKRVGYLYTIYRAKKSVKEIMSSESYGATTPPHLRCSTPEPATYWAGESARFLQEFAEEVEAYKERSSGIGDSTA